MLFIWIKNNTNNTGIKEASLIFDINLHKLLFYNRIVMFEMYISTKKIKVLGTKRSIGNS